VAEVLATGACFETGALSYVRVSEICEIKVKDIDSITNGLSIVGKRGKLWEVAMRPTLRKTFGST
jgi:integrase